MDWRQPAIRAGCSEELKPYNPKNQKMIFIAPDGYIKWLPTGAIFPQKCGRWEFENAIGHENSVKSRPMEQKMLSTGRGSAYCAEKFWEQTNFLVNKHIFSKYFGL